MTQTSTSISVDCLQIFFNKSSPFLCINVALSLPVSLQYQFLIILYLFHLWNQQIFVLFTYPTVLHFGVRLYRLKCCISEYTPRRGILLWFPHFFPPTPQKSTLPPANQILILNWLPLTVLFVWGFDVTGRRRF